MIICLNGTSSSGKTALARELQELLGGYALYFSIDHILYSLPPSALGRMTIGGKNPGLDYRKLEEGFYRCVRVLSEVGHDLIIDNAIVSEKSARLLINILTGLNVFMVGVSCSTAELIRRECARGDRTIGEAESQASNIHLFCKYDLSIDSTSASPKELAQKVHKVLCGNPKLSAFSETANRLR